MQQCVRKARTCSIKVQETKALPAPLSTRNRNMFCARLACRVLQVSLLSFRIPSTRPTSLGCLILRGSRVQRGCHNDQSRLDMHMNDPCIIASEIIDNNNHFPSHQHLHLNHDAPIPRSSRERGRLLGL